jgi:hypothetical protein
VHGFLGNNNSETYKELLENFIQQYCLLGCRTSLTGHSLRPQMDFFTTNLSDVSQAHWECIHEDIEAMQETAGMTGYSNDGKLQFGKSSNEEQRCPNIQF